MISTGISSPKVLCLWSSKRAPTAFFCPRVMMCWFWAVPRDGWAPCHQHQTRGTVKWDASPVLPPQLPYDCWGSGNSPRTGVKTKLSAERAWQSHLGVPVARQAGRGLIERSRRGRAGAGASPGWAAAAAARGAPHPRRACRGSPTGGGGCPGGRRSGPGGSGRRLWGAARVRGGGEAPASKVQAPRPQHPARPEARTESARSEVSQAPRSGPRRETPGPLHLRPRQRGLRPVPLDPATVCPARTLRWRAVGKLVVPPSWAGCPWTWGCWFLPRLRWILRREGTEPSSAPGERRATLNWAAAGTSPAATAFPYAHQQGQARLWKVEQVCRCLCVRGFCGASCLRSWLSSRSVTEAFSGTGLGTRGCLQKCRFPTLCGVIRWLSVLCNIPCII